MEDLALESVQLSPDLIEVRIRNVSPTAVVVAQVLVNDAYWNHSVSDRDLSRLETATVSIPYPWNEGLPLHLDFLTEAGARIGHEIPVATRSPTRDLASLWR